VVDGRTVTHAANVTTLPANKRYKRREVTGGHGLEVNENGVFYRGTNKVAKKGKHAHLIHPGAYSGPVWPAHGAYLLDPNGDHDGKRHVCHERFVADLVAYEFLGAPPAGWADTLVVHLDGDRSNAAPDNLLYVVDEAKVEAKQRKIIEAMMKVSPRGADHKPRARDPYGTKTRNPYAKNSKGERREGADLALNPPWLPTQPRMFEPLAS